MPTIGTAYAAVFVINLNGLLASGAFVGHLLLYSSRAFLRDRSTERPRDVSGIKDPPAKV
jgi:hypothetical protein